MILRCECEAVYKQTETAVAHWIEDSVDCRICGHPLKSWCGNAFLSFELVKNPTE
jgi:hypothetical protein